MTQLAREPEEVTEAELVYLEGRGVLSHGAGAKVKGSDLAYVLRQRRAGRSIKDIAQELGMRKQNVLQREYRAIRCINAAREIAELPEDSIERLNLSVRAYNGLRGAAWPEQGPFTISEAIRLFDNGSVKRTPNIGKKSLAEIAAQLEPYR